MKPTPHLLQSQAWRGLRIGLLGGSFNPAHEGHLHISLHALKKMQLDYVWWLVSPQNPLKSGKNMAAFSDRVEGAKRLVKNHPRILVTGLEAEMGTRFTADTLKKLSLRFPHTRFVWMMGADNLLQIPQWERWTDIFTLADVAVFRRPPYFVGATHGVAATRFQKSRLPPSQAAFLARGPEKHWILFTNPLHHASATQIREGKKP